MRAICLQRCTRWLACLIHVCLCLCLRSVQLLAAVRHAPQVCFWHFRLFVRSELSIHADRHRPIAQPTAGLCAFAHALAGGKVNAHTSLSLSLLATSACVTQPYSETRLPASSLAISKQTAAQSALDQHHPGCAHCVHTAGVAARFVKSARVRVHPAAIHRSSIISTPPHWPFSPPGSFRNTHQQLTSLAPPVFR